MVQVELVSDMEGHSAAKLEARFKNILVPRTGPMNRGKTYAYYVVNAYYAYYVNYVFFAVDDDNFMTRNSKTFLGRVSDLSHMLVNITVMLSSLYHLYCRHSSPISINRQGRFKEPGSAREAVCAGIICVKHINA